MKVSIIIPVYNVSDYVEHCLQSVMVQTYTDMECIIVDDCTPDDSIEKCERMIAGYDGPIAFKILHHERNRGLSAARNTGIDAATGEYVYFLDSDDWIIPECIQLMCDCIEKHPETELVMGGAIATNGGFLFMDYEKKGFLPEYSNDVDWINKALLSPEMLSIAAWNILIKRVFLLYNNLYFIEGLINEDNVWHFLLSKHVLHLSILHKNTYVYVFRENSIMNGTNKVFLERNWITVFNICLDYCGGRFKKREISSVFLYLHFKYIHTDDITLKKGLRLVLFKALRKTSLIQKLGILLYLSVPQKYLYGRKISGVIFSLIGVDRKSMRLK